MAFVNEKRTLILSNGEQVVLPRMTIGKILSVTNAISILVKAVKKEYPDFFKNEDYGTIAMQFIKCLPEMFPVIGEQVVGVIATYLGKDNAWVNDVMDMEDLVAVATPFLQTIMAQGNHLLGAINQSLGKSPSPDQNTETSTTSSEVQNPTSPI